MTILGNTVQKKPLGRGAYLFLFSFFWRKWNLIFLLLQLWMQLQIFVLPSCRSISNRQTYYGQGDFPCIPIWRPTEGVSYTYKSQQRRNFKNIFHALWALRPDLTLPVVFLPPACIVREGPTGLWRQDIPLSVVTSPSISRISCFIQYEHRAMNESLRCW